MVGEQQIGEWEWVRCEICGSDERRLVAQRVDLLLGGDTTYSMYECQSCGVLYQNPRPSPATIPSLYPAEYQPFTPSLHAEDRLRRADRRFGLGKRARLVTQHVKGGGRLLDVGCATGDFLSEMHRLPGWTVIGIEPIHVAAKYARQQVGIDVIEAWPTTAPVGDGAFDTVTLWDVLEHVHNPRGVISECARLMSNESVLVINHPNLDSVDRRLFGRFWAGYELPRHLFLFPARLLRELMAEYGLVEIDRQCLYGSHAAAGTSMGFMLKARLGHRRSEVEWVLRVLFSRASRVLLAPYFKLIDALGRGSNITVVFKKKR
ncbi:MAG: class I SAM-dependent methyltransferase [Chloroflexi bacterium]|nr:class I SAM-dependent methyltransferase [Chloroflexota bacterium]